MKPWRKFAESSQWILAGTRENQMHTIHRSHPQSQMRGRGKYAIVCSISCCDLFLIMIDVLCNMAGLGREMIARVLVESQKSP
jgi:hypothetical protein